MVPNRFSVKLFTSETILLCFGNSRNVEKVVSHISVMYFFSWWIILSGIFLRKKHFKWNKLKWFVLSWSSSRKKVWIFRSMFSFIRFSLWKQFILKSESSLPAKWSCEVILIHLMKCFFRESESEIFLWESGEITALSLWDTPVTNRNATSTKYVTYTH